MKYNQPVSKKIRILAVIALLMLFMVLIYDLIILPSGIKESLKLIHVKHHQVNDLNILKDRNHGLIMVINELHHFGDGYERHVRYETGLIKKNERYYKFAPNKSPK